jgi:primosomal protein N'
MNYYKVIPSIRLPYDYLTYGSNEELSRGQVVTIPVRNKVQYGIIEAQEETSSFDTTKVKAIKDSFQFRLHKNQMNLLYTFAFNTFNKLTVASNLFIQPFKILPQKDIKLLSLLDDYPDSNQKRVPVSYELQNNLTVRIRYIIRNIISPSVSLFLFPEHKLLQRVYQEIISDIPELKETIQIYTGKKDKVSKQTVKKLLLEPHSNIIVFGVRSSLFLPFQKLDSIYCLDEGNPYYIQEQNSVYYDARDTVYLLAQAYQTSLTFISSLPSIRLHRMYYEAFLEDTLIKGKDNTSKSLKIKITNIQAKFGKNSLFSDDLEEYLKNFIDEDTPIGYFDGDEL